VGVGLRKSWKWLDFTKRFAGLRRVARNWLGRCRGEEGVHAAYARTDAVELHRPAKPWELLQIGNCGSPLETEAGWLVLTHGVGPMRRYTIGALLLDLDDPSRVIGCLEQPLLEPEVGEREGYVPNVLYSCGGLIHRDKLVLPYGFSDAGVGIAIVSLPELLAELLATGA
jgi:predicted GH43/DUF377 family glycosyl hydrolase